MRAEPTAVHKLVHWRHSTCIPSTRIVQARSERLSLRRAAARVESIVLRLDPRSAPTMCALPPKRPPPSGGALGRDWRVPAPRLWFVSVARALRIAAAQDPTGPAPAWCDCVCRGARARSRA